MTDGREKRILILGSTGSIGRNTLRVIESLPGRFRVVGLAAGSDDRLLASQAARCGTRLLAMADRSAAARLRSSLGSGYTILEGPDGVADLVDEAGADLVVSAIAGSPGLLPTWRAVRRGTDVALANKEPLVMAGQAITREAKRTGATLIPVDSEHHALDVALRGVSPKDVEAVTITASGGPFLDTPADRLATVTVEEALRHPRWKMGSKITIDSATLMNKGLEIIEAHWLFGFPGDGIRVVVHPESIVHGIVHLADGGMIAYLSVPDMRIPIAAALNRPEILPLGLPPLDLASAGSLTFREPDNARFPALNLAREVLRAGGTAPAILNAANETAVHAFLAGGIAFTRITEAVGEVLEAVGATGAGTIEEVIAADRAARVETRRLLGQAASETETGGF
jgi:1-deoxy-D-xylulose-5-phosphate reductoisomerase